MGIIDWDKAEQDYSALWDDMDTEDTYALRIVFVERETGETMVSLMPWLTYELDHAYYLSHAVSYDPVIGMALLSDWLGSGDTHLPDGKEWRPIGVRVVKLAPVPF